MFRTHILFALFFYLLFAKIFSFPISITFTLILCFGAILPDIDSPKSFVNKKYLFGFGRTVAAFSKHRGFFHSIFGLFLTTFIFFIPIYLFKLPLVYCFALSSGYFLHLLADSFTVSGINWFWKGKFKIKGHLVTGSTFESIIFFVLIFGIIYFIIGSSWIKNLTAFVMNIRP